MSTRHPLIFKAGKALAAHGKGLHLHQEHENEEKAEDIWDMIADNWNPNEHDPYAYVKYFVRLQDMIEHDETFQKVLDKVKTYMYHHLPFEKALDKSVNETKQLIHKAFAASDDELWSSMKQDEIKNNDELDISKCTLCIIKVLNVIMYSKV